jgi:Immunoglobulin-like domain of bacterial spore germination/Sporulation and spore germination
MKRLLFVVALVFGVVSLAAACGGGGEATPAGEVPTVDLPNTSEEPPPSTAPEPSQPSDPEPGAEPEPGGESEPEPSEETFTYEVWFASGDSLFVVHRTEPKVPAVAMTAMESLLEGPSDTEAAAGISSAIPADTTLLGVTVEDGIATVDLSAEYESGGGSLSMMMRLAQVVYTLTQFPSIKRVRLEGEEHVRADFEDYTPPVLVESPLPGEPVTTPVRIDGTANTFEATFNVEVVDARDKVLGERFVTATSGSGTRGTFDAEVEFKATADGPGELVVFELSAEDGSRMNEVRIPLQLRVPR